MECDGMRESTSRNQANGSMPHRLQEATKLRKTAAGSRANHLVRRRWRKLQKAQRDVQIGAKRLCTRGDRLQRHHPVRIARPVGDQNESRAHSTTAPAERFRIQEIVRNCAAQRCL